MPAVFAVTFTVQECVDVFTRKAYADLLVNSIHQSQHLHGLKIYAWVIMPSHCQLIYSSENNTSDPISDLKKESAGKIIEAIECNETEGRKKWLLPLLKNEHTITFWKNEEHREEITTKKAFDINVSAIHLSPVKAGIVEKEEEYLLSSCADLYGNRKGILELEIF